MVLLTLLGHKKGGKGKDFLFFLGWGRALQHTCSSGTCSDWPLVFFFISTIIYYLFLSLSISSMPRTEQLHVVKKKSSLKKINGVLSRTLLGLCVTV